MPTQEEMEIVQPVTESEADKETIRYLQERIAELSKLLPPEPAISMEEAIDGVRQEAMERLKEATNDPT
jgi:hypothetical protein